DLRPSSPLSSGPTLFFAPSPTEWHGRHFLNDCSPAPTSCARAVVLEAASTAVISSKVLVMIASSQRFPDRHQADGSPRARPAAPGWRAGGKVSTAIRRRLRRKGLGTTARKR